MNFLNIKHWFFLLICCLLSLTACNLSSPGTSNSPKALFEEYFESLEIKIIEEQVDFRTRAGEEASVKQKKATWNGATKAYRACKYEEAIVAFKEYLRKYEDDEKAKLFLAISLLELGRVEEAVPYLEILMEQQESLYFEHSQWLRALAYLHEGNRKSAKRILHQIIRLDWHYYQEKAGGLLPKLEEL